MFNVDKSGMVVNISSDGIAFNVTTGLISGTSLVLATIEAIGCTWEVTSSGTVANVKLIPIGENISSGCFGISEYRKFLYAPYASYWQTLGSVTGMYPTLMHSAAEDLGWGTGKVEMTNDYIFLELASEVRRVSVTGTSSLMHQVWTFEGDNWGQYCLYDDEKIYVMEQEEFNPSVSIKRINFGGYGGPTETYIYSFLEEDYYHSQSYLLFTPLYLNRVKYGSWDCIVCVAYYSAIDSDVYPQYILRCIIYNVNTGSISDQWFEATDGTWYPWDADLYSIYYNLSSPSFYQTKMIFTITIDGFVDWFTPPYPTVCLLPSFIIDVSDNTITRVDTYKQQPYFVTTYDITSTIDYSDAKYYFTAWLSSLSKYVLFFVDINSETMSEEGDFIELSDSSEQFQSSYIGGVMVERTAAPGSCNVLQIPALYNINTVDIYVEHGSDYFESALAVDIPQSIIWNVRSNTLQGKRIGSGVAVNKDIAVYWGGAGTVPFTYSNNREVMLRILNRKAVIVVRSNYIPSSNYQLDFYLLTDEEP